MSGDSSLGLSISNFDKRYYHKARAVNMFCWGCGIPALYGPFVVCMDFIDGEGVFCQLDHSSTDLVSESDYVTHASTRHHSMTVGNALHESPQSHQKGKTAIASSLNYSLPMNNMSLTYFLSLPEYSIFNNRDCIR